MAYEYVVDTQDRIVHVRMWGSVTFPEIATVVAELASDPRIGTEFAEIVDLTGATTATLRADDVRAIAYAKTIYFSRRAFVAPDPPTYGLVRLFGAHREMSRPQERVGVFKTLTEATLWLGSGG